MNLTSLIKTKGFGIFVVLVIGGYLIQHFMYKDNFSHLSSDYDESNFISTRMIIKSSAFANNQPIPAVYTCDGLNTIPPLEWTDVPDVKKYGVKSFVLIVEDPDAPNGTFVHWVRFNIPADVRKIEEGKEPAGLAGRGSSGSTKYVGPCPPDKQHSYWFELYAINKVLDLPEGSTKDQVIDAIQGYIVQAAIFGGVYNRPQNKS